MSAKFNIHCSTDVLKLSFDSDWEYNTRMQKLYDAILNRCHGFENRSWAVIDDIRRWPVKSPKEIELCFELSKHLKTKGMTHFAVCLNDIALSKWMMQKIVPAGVELAFFKNQQECKDWLKTQGFDTEFDEKPKPHNLN
jgi:uncharacterized protein YbdZ (MbtH family)